MLPVPSKPFENGDQSPGQPGPAGLGLAASLVGVQALVPARSQCRRCLVLLLPANRAGGQGQ